MLSCTINIIVVSIKTKFTKTTDMPPLPPPTKSRTSIVLKIRKSVWFCKLAIWRIYGWLYIYIYFGGELMASSGKNYKLQLRNGILKFCQTYAAGRNCWDTFVDFHSNISEGKSAPIACRL